MMLRWMLALILSSTFLAPATASLSRRPRPAIPKALPGLNLASIRPTSANTEYRLTATTEVLLDGQPCRYEDVPDGATIVLLETVSNEDKEIVRVHFKTSPKVIDSARK